MPEHMIEHGSTTELSRTGGAGTAIASIAALGSVLAASSCCLPIFSFMLAASLAGGSAFLSAARPYLMAASILAISFGFYHAWRVKKCNRRPRVINSVLLWMSTVFVAASIFFPQMMANAVADVLAR
jgi:cytochrome bd-type quinol oxidase subunit 2